MNLSVELQSWRADRPDEWKMDDFIRKASKLEKENAELLAKIELIKQEVNGIISDSSGVAGYHLNGRVAFWDEFYLVDLVDEAPAQCLNQIKAEAGRAGWLACWNWISSDSDLNLEQKTFEDFANEYAVSVVKGE